MISVLVFLLVLVAGVGAFLYVRCYWQRVQPPARTVAVHTKQVNRTSAARTPPVTLAACGGERNVTVWRPSVRPSVFLSVDIHVLTVTHQGSACDAASVCLGLTIKRTEIFVRFIVDLLCSKSVTDSQQIELEKLSSIEDQGQTDHVTALPCSYTLDISRSKAILVTVHALTHILSAVCSLGPLK